MNIGDFLMHIYPISLKSPVISINKNDAELLSASFFTL